MTGQDAAAPLPHTDPSPVDAAPVPTCPLCDSPMAERLVRRGPQAGTRYWGCSRDPECLGRRSITPDLQPAPTTAGAPEPTTSSPGPTPDPVPPPAHRPAVRVPPPVVSRRPPQPQAPTFTPRSAARVVDTAGDSIRRAPAFLGATDDLARRANAGRTTPSPLWVGLAIGLVGLVLVIGGPMTLGPDPGAQARIVGAVLVGGGLVVAAAGTVLARGARALGIGGDGDLLTTRALEPLATEGWQVLHGRRMPASPEHIDQLIVGPGGIFTVASVAAPGHLSIRGHDVFLNGRRRTRLVELARRQAAATVAVLRAAGHADTAVALLCVHRASLPVFGSSLDGVAIVDAHGLVRRLKGEPRKLDAARVAILTDALTRGLPATDAHERAPR